MTRNSGGCEVRVSCLHLPEKVGGKGIGGAGEQCVCTSSSRLGLRVCTSLTSEGWGLCVLPVDLLHPLSPERGTPQEERFGVLRTAASRPAVRAKPRTHQIPFLTSEVHFREQTSVSQQSQAAETAAVILLCCICTRAGRRAPALREHAVTLAALFL